MKRLGDLRELLAGGLGMQKGEEKRCRDRRGSTSYTYIDIQAHLEENNILASPLISRRTHDSTIHSRYTCIPIVPNGATIYDCLRALFD